MKEQIGIYMKRKIRQFVSLLSSTIHGSILSFRCICMSELEFF
jgi:hypothetical protein